VGDSERVWGDGSTGGGNAGDKGWATDDETERQRHERGGAHASVLTGTAAWASSPCRSSSVFYDGDVRYDYSDDVNRGAQHLLNLGGGAATQEYCLVTERPGTECDLVGRCRVILMARERWAHH